MPRRPRLVIPGAPHHVTQRGNNRQPTFTSDSDRYDYVDILRADAERCGVSLLAWCLMTNHVHLAAVPDRQDSLSAMMQRVNSRYAVRFNRRTERVGHLWQNRFYSCVLSETHLFRTLRYIELNPVRAGLCLQALQWPWSSALAHTHPRAADLLLRRHWPDYFRDWDYSGWSEGLTADLPARELQSIRNATLRGDPLGASDFADTLEIQLGRTVRVAPRGRPANKGL